MWLHIMANSVTNGRNRLHAIYTITGMRNIDITITKYRFEQTVNFIISPQSTRRFLRTLEIIWKLFRSKISFEKYHYQRITITLFNC